MNRLRIPVLIATVALFAIWLVSENRRPESSGVKVASERANAPAVATGEGTSAKPDAALTAAPEPVLAPDDSPATVLVFEAPPLEAMLAEAKQVEEERGVLRFASALKADVTPESDGVWSDAGDGRLRWELSIQSPGAKNLNLGFTEYHMPEGGTLTMRRPGGEAPWRPFTADDNEEHGQLWTPVLDGEAMEIEVVVPESRRDELQLRLAAVNHGFRRFGADKSVTGDKIGNEIAGASCYVDVNCDAGEAGTAMIDFYRDQIRSVGAYTVSGLDICTGALINNARRDGRPLFLTAFHCFGLTGGPQASAPTLVVYWNFQNSTCRLPGSLDATRLGDGNLTVFNAGTNYLAGNVLSDFVLLELDDPLNILADAYFAGWDRSGGGPTMSATVHHPGTTEKRISFDFDAGNVTSHLMDAFPGDGSHVKIFDWDIGSTQSGSSGAPLFDQNKRIIGQLHGGGAFCGNNLPDWFGRFAHAWDNNGTPNAPITQLKEWLDPDNTQIFTLEGMNQVTISVGDVTVLEGTPFDAAPFMFIPVNLSRPAEGPLQVSWATADNSATLANLDYTAGSGTVSFVAGESVRYGVATATPDYLPESDEAFNVNIFLPISTYGATILDGTGLGIILNDDFNAPPAFVPGTLTGFGSSGVPYAQFIPLQAGNSATSYTVLGAPAGMSFSGGLLVWPEPTGGTYFVILEASNIIGSAMEVFTLTVAEDARLTAIDAPAGKLPIRDVLANPSQPSGSAPWFSQTTYTHDGIDAVQSGDIDEFGESAFEVTVQGPGVVSFWWASSSEAGFDDLEFYVNGLLVDTISGFNNPVTPLTWEQIFQDLPPGMHTLRWQYEKDLSLSFGLDAGFVDEIAFSGYTGWVYGYNLVGFTSLTDNIEGDPLNNLGEYGLGRDPTKSDHVNTPEISSVGGKRLLTVTKPAGVTGVNYFGDGSVDGLTWSILNMTKIFEDATTIVFEESFPGLQPDTALLRLLMTPQ